MIATGVAAAISRKLNPPITTMPVNPKKKVLPPIGGRGNVKRYIPEQPNRRLPMPIVKNPVVPRMPIVRAPALPTVPSYTVSPSPRYGMPSNQSRFSDIIANKLAEKYRQF